MAEKNKIYGLLGKNISYSLSPVMHNAAFKKFGIEAVYQLFDIDDSEFDDFIGNTILPGMVCGLNVTVPYKMRMKEWLEKNSAEVDELVKVTGSLNTVKINSDNVYGYNTDLLGFLYAIKMEFGQEATLKIKKVFICGAGGAGRAIALFLAGNKFEGVIDKITVYDISKDRLDSLKKDFDQQYDANTASVSLKTIELKSDIFEEIKNCNLIVNATPLGTKDGDSSPIPLDVLQEGMLVYDLVYARETELVRGAKAKNIKASNGLNMLVNQGALSFEIWTGNPWERVKDVMKEAVLKYLGRS